MASLSQSQAALTGGAASDFLRSSSNGVRGFPLKMLGRARFTNRRDISVTAKLRKVKKHVYPWPDNPDPNVKGGILTHLSSFKPLKEKPKPVILDFEKPLAELEKKIIDVRKMANETGLDFSDQIAELESKHQKALRNLYTHLVPIQRVNIARHPNRPTFLDHMFNITDKFVEIHGDRAGYDDPAIVTGIGTIDGKRYMFMGHQKGRNTKENIQRNFGMPTPHGYRKALRMMYYADHHGFPIVTFIDTPGAYADLKSEELGQGEAIANNLRTMFGLKVPIISIVIGEGGSGGALAIGCANKLLMLENAVFYVASPEACAAILWKTAKASPKAAQKLKITARELCKLKVADGIIREPLGGAHADPAWTSERIKAAIIRNMDELAKMDTEELLKHRMAKFRKLGGFQDQLPVERIKKINMKFKEKPRLGTTAIMELQDEVERLKQQVSRAKELRGDPPVLALSDMLQILKEEIDHEYSKAIKDMGLEKRFASLRQEFQKANSGGQLIDSSLVDEMEKLKDEFNKSLLVAPNYASLKSKQDMLKELSKAQSQLVNSGNVQPVIKHMFKNVIDQPNIKQKIKELRAEVRKSGVSNSKNLDQGLKEKMISTKKLIGSEFISSIQSMVSEVKTLKLNTEGSAIKAPLSDYKAKAEDLNKEIHSKIEDAVNSSDLKNMIALLKLKIAMAGNSPNGATKYEIGALQEQIKERLSEAIRSSELKEKHEELTKEISDALELSEGSNGSLKKESRVEVST